MKQCYYELLEVDKKATAAEIKTNYRKLALKYHPDKNPSEQGRQMFLLITEAYEVLSDPNERTWYDNNRQKILFNKDDMSKQDLEMYSFGFNIWGYFTSTCFKGFDDTEAGFYSVYRNVFQKLKAQEAKAFNMREDKQQQQVRKYEGFGDSNTIRDKVLQFYEDWQNFTTYKTFVWVDEWDTRDAQNRYVKRQMQKQNKKQRQKQKKNYIKTIKDLVTFLKKRDPRYRQYLMDQKKKEQERQLAKKQKQQQKKKQKQQMKKVKQQLEEQRFKQIEQYYKKQQQSVQSNNKKHEASSDGGQGAFYCAICQKQFKSQNQLKNHQNSKMHKKNVKILQQEVMSKAQMVQQAKKQQQQQQYQSSKTKKNKKKNKNNKNIQEQEQQEKQPVKKQNAKKQQKKQEKPKQQKKQANKPVKQQKAKPKQEDQQQKGNNKNNKKNNKKNKKKNEQSSQQQVIIKKQQKPAKKQPQKKQQPKKPETQSDSDDTDAFMNAILKKTRPKKQVEVPIVQQKRPEQKKQPKKPVQKVQSSQEQSDNEQRKKGKAKLKRQKKQNKKQQTGFKCNVCSQSFPSKTKLFDHITKTGHAKAK